MQGDDEEPAVEELTEAQIGEAIADKSRSFYVGTSSRLGFHAFAALVEYSFFHPRLGPESNAQFHYYAFRFGLPICMFSIPRRYEKRANEIARKLKLKPVTGVVPVLLGPNGLEKFPGAKEAATGRQNLFVIEGGDPLVYNNDRLLNQQVHDRESEVVDTLMRRGPVMTPKQVADFLWRRH